MQVEFQGLRRQVTGFAFGRKEGGGVPGWERSSVVGSAPECRQTSACG